MLLLVLSLASCAGDPALRSIHAATAGSYQTTGRPLDLAIKGDGYFIVQTTAGGFLFTRNGALSVSSTSELVNDDGYRFYPPITFPAGATGITITPDGAVRASVNGENSNVLSQIVISRFLDDEKVERDGEYALPTAGSGDPITGRPGSKGLGTLLIGQLESGK